MNVVFKGAMKIICQILIGVSIILVIDPPKLPRILTTIMFLILWSALWTTYDYVMRQD